MHSAQPKKIAICLDCDAFFSFPGIYTGTQFVWVCLEYDEKITRHTLTKTFRETPKIKRAPKETHKLSYDECLEGFGGFGNFAGSVDGSRGLEHMLTNAADISELRVQLL